VFLKIQSRLLSWSELLSSSGKVGRTLVTNNGLWRFAFRNNVDVPLYDSRLRYQLNVADGLARRRSRRHEDARIHDWEAAGNQPRSTTTASWHYVVIRNKSSTTPRIIRAADGEQGRWFCFVRRSCIARDRDCWWHGHLRPLQQLGAVLVGSRVCRASCEILFLQQWRKLLLAYSVCFGSWSSI
jgi:hypothetical protein